MFNIIFWILTFWAPLGCIYTILFSKPRVKANKVQTGTEALIHVIMGGPVLWIIFVHESYKRITLKKSEDV